MIENLDLQKPLSNAIVKLLPLQENDFEDLFRVASDPLIWEQHPNKQRYKREVFEVYFKGAIKSKAAYKIYDAVTGELIGSSRFYKIGEANERLAIGYTFYARSHWGGKYNAAVKQLMCEHAFTQVDEVYFEVGASNIRSQKSIERLGAIKVDEKEVEYYGEDSNLNFIYLLQPHTLRRDLQF